MKKPDEAKSFIQVIKTGKDTVTLRDPVYNIVPTGPSDFKVEGEVVFAGYGIKADKYNYNDFENILTEGRILLILDRAPLTADGRKSLFEEPEWMGEMNFQSKITALVLSKAKAVIIVCDPKSGFRSMAESNSPVAQYLSSKSTLTGKNEDSSDSFMALMPKIAYIGRSVADAILDGTGHSLKGLQDSIDAAFKPFSFIVPGKTVTINSGTNSEKKTLKNVAGFIEGSDNILKNEVVVFSAHYDHIGETGNKINTGADDDASGCAALLSIAEAFRGLDKKPLRSVLFLWVSGEEIGLFGSESYVRNPLFPLNNTVADLNIDMIGREKSEADSTDETPMTGPGKVFVITDNQSTELRRIADREDNKSKIDFDYSLSGRNHPLHLFQRSDHFNFVKNDIPVLFFTTGLHTDYHTPADVPGKLDYRKMELIARTMFDIGLTVANNKKRIVVDNPYSKW
jgi:hypothetical protein